MQRFLEMVTHMQVHGIVGFFGHAKNARLVPPSDEDWSVLEGAHQFVFSEEYPVFEEEVGQQLWDNAVATGPLAVTNCILENGIPCKIETYCIVIKEYSPKCYGFWTYCLRYEGDFEPLWLCTKSNVDAPIVAHYLKRLEKEKTGIEPARASVKIGVGKNKRTKRIKRIIHVAPKKRMLNYSPSSGTRHIDWSHRFEVRGHWVSLPGKLGKDREGTYCVKDWTWRSHYIKGAEHLPLIKKTRLVE